MNNYENMGILIELGVFREVQSGGHISMYESAPSCMNCLACRDEGLQNYANKTRQFSNLTFRDQGHFDMLQEA